MHCSISITQRISADGRALRGDGRAGSAILGGALGISVLRLAHAIAMAI